MPFAAANLICHSRRTRDNGMHAWHWCIVVDLLGLAIVCSVVWWLTNHRFNRWKIDNDLSISGFLDRAAAAVAYVKHTRLQRNWHNYRNFQTIWHIEWPHLHAPRPHCMRFYYAAYVPNVQWRSCDNGRILWFLSGQKARWIGPEKTHLPGTAHPFPLLVSIIIITIAANNSQHVIKCN